MIDLKTEDDGSLVSFTVTDEITADDIAALGAAIDGSINKYDRIPALLVHAPKLPRYDSFAALFAHLKLVHSHETLLPRVAAVSDGVLMGIGQSLADLFLKADIRHFVEADIEVARDWARSGEESYDAVKILDGFPNDVLAMEISGRLRAADYEQVIDPLIAEKLTRHKKLKVLLVVGEGFEGATSGAAWDDMKLGLRNFTKYSKLAIVTDLNWMRNSVRLMAPFMPARVHTYPLFKKDLAEDWIKT